MKKVKKTETNVAEEKAEQKSKECKDKHCPFHAGLTTRGQTFRGKVLSSSMHRSVTVGWTRIVYVPKYERYTKKRSKIKAHNPDCINAKNGDEVIITECKPISKTKSFVVIQKIEK